MPHEIALIGYGEAGSTFARAAGWGARASGWDLIAHRRAAMAADGLVPAGSAAEAFARAPLVLSLVTADSAINAARDYAPLLASGTIWCDMNSVAPKTKREAAEAVEAAGGRYVDVAVLAPMNPARLAVPLLLAGKAAGEAEALLRSVGFFNTRVVGDEVGRASAIKMCRSAHSSAISAIPAPISHAMTIW